MVRLTTTEWFSDPEVALIVTCETSGVGFPVIFPGAVVFIPPQPAIPPIVSTDSRSKSSAPLTLVNRLRKPNRVKRPNGSIPTKITRRPGRDAEYGFVGVGVAVAMATITIAALELERLT